MRLNENSHTPTPLTSKVDALEQERECLVCLEAKLGFVAVIPCGHRLCVDCAVLHVGYVPPAGEGAGVEGGGGEAGRVCVTCRGPVTGTLRLF